MGQNSSKVMWKTHCQLSQTLDCSCYCQGWHNQLLDFHVGPGRFGQLFSFNKWNYYFKSAFCIYSGYLCVILKFVWWSETFKCDKYAKNKKTGRGQKPFHGTVCIYIIHTHTHIYIYIYIYIYTYTYAGNTTMRWVIYGQTQWLLGIYGQ